MSRIVDALPADPSLDFAGQYLASLPSPASRTRMARCVQTLARRALGWRLPTNVRRIPWSELSRAQVLELVRALDDMHPSTQRLHVTALRGILREADAPASVVAAAQRSKGTRVVPGRALNLTEVRALERAAEGKPRDAALVALLVYGGLRVSELVGLDASSWASPIARVVGKGNKERAVALPPPAAQAVDAYLRGRTEGPLLTGWKGQAHGRRMTVAGVQRLLVTLGKHAKLEHFSPHDLRRTCVTTASAAGVPIQHIAAHCGHSSVVTTQKYMRADPLELSRETAQKLHLHYSQTRAQAAALEQETPCNAL